MQLLLIAKKAENQYFLIVFGQIPQFGSGAPVPLHVKVVLAAAVKSGNTTYDMQEKSKPPPPPPFKNFSLFNTK